MTYDTSRRRGALAAMLISGLLGAWPATAQLAGYTDRPPVALDEALAGYERGEHPAVFPEIARFAREGDAVAQSMVGRIYALGHGAPKHLPTAAHWYERSANQGFAVAQYQFAKLLEGGFGRDKDAAKAAALLEKAAGQGLPIAQLDLGLAYQSGNGVNKDNAQAAKWLSLAASAKGSEGDRARAALAELEKSAAADVAAGRKLAAAVKPAAPALVASWSRKAHEPYVPTGGGTAAPTGLPIPKS